MPDQIGSLAAMDGYTPEEADFQFGVRATPWFSEFTQQHGEPNLNDPNYDYRAAWTAGARPNVRDPGDNQLHWSSQFKGPEHPNRFVNGVDTITGQPVSTGEEYAGLGGDPSHLANTIKDWWMQQKSWSDRAKAENQRTAEAFQRGGMGEIAKQLSTDTTEAQDLVNTFAPGALAAVDEYRPPFYSAVEQAVQGAKQNAAPGQQWAGFLRNQPGVKQEEVQALGLGKLFEQPSVSKEAMLGEIAANKVNVGEVIKSERSQRPAAERVNSIDDRLYAIQDEMDRLHHFDNSAASERRAVLAAQERELQTERQGIVQGQDGQWLLRFDDGFEGSPRFPTREAAAAFLREGKSHTNVHTIDITPQLRAQAMKGFPLFTAGGVAATGIMGEMARQDEYR